MRLRIVSPGMTLGWTKLASSSRGALTLVVLSTLLVASSPALAQTFNQLHTFTGPDGAEPLAAPVPDAASNLYGTSEVGGQHNAGSVFELAPIGGDNWNETVLYSFCSQPNCTDGYLPSSSLIFDNAGNLYGTASKPNRANNDDQNNGQHYSVLGDVLTFVVTQQFS
jgi:uncharacterized repeat protein (TIGR03803 family)